MKKNIRLSVLLAGLAFSSVTFGQAENEIGSLGASGIITTDLCSVLATKTSVKLSSNSLMAYKCSPIYNQIVGMTCNTAGSRTPATQTCVFTADADGSTTYEDVVGDWNDASCTAPTDQFDIVGGRYFTMSSAGGGIAVSGGAATDTCDTTTMEGVI